MIRYYCSGFDINNAFGYGLGDMFKSELISTNSIVYIVGGPEKVEKAKKIYVPAFTEHFLRVGIQFKNVDLITPETDPIYAQEKVKNASFVFLLGGNPLKQKEMCKNLGLLPILKSYEGIMLGMSAGAMLMSKYIIITPRNEQENEFIIENGLNLDNLSIYPHNNTSKEEYPNIVNLGKKIYKKEDLIEVAKKYGPYYLLQDNVNIDGLTDISYIKSVDGNIKFYTENFGKLWIVSKDEVKLLKK